MNGYDALKLLKKGTKIRKKNWGKDWYLFIDVAKHKRELIIESYFVNYSPKMKEQFIEDNHKYSEIIDDLVYDNWETYEDDED